MAVYCRKLAVSSVIIHTAALKGGGAGTFLYRERSIFKFEGYGVNDIHQSAVSKIV